MPVRTRTRTLALALAAAAALGACDPSTRGDLGHVRFRYDGGLYGCLYGCDADEPIAAGAFVELVVVNADALPSCSGASNAPAVMDWTGDCDGLLHGTALAPGAATLVLTRDLDATILDRTDFDVADVAHVVLGDPAPLAHLVIATGGTSRVLARSYDARARRLVGVGALDYEVSGALPGALTLATARAYVDAGLRVGTVQDFVEILAGTTPAAGTLRATAKSGVFAALDVTLVDESEVAQLVLTPEPDVPRAGLPWLVEAIATDAAGRRIHSPACTWDITPSSEFEGDPGRDAALLLPTRSGALVSVLCRVGAADAQIFRRVR